MRFNLYLKERVDSNNAACAKFLSVIDSNSAWTYVPGAVNSTNLSLKHFEKCKDVTKAVSPWSVCVSVLSFLCTAPVLHLNAA